MLLACRIKGGGCNFTLISWELFTFTFDCRVISRDILNNTNTLAGQVRGMIEDP